jgi:hypothetical protein
MRPIWHRKTRAFALGLSLSLFMAITPGHSSNSFITLAQAGSGQVELAAGHPDRYVVQVGDTLWDISSMFLRDPWLWPEIWYVNPQIENPHLIYPGDIISLVYVDGQPQLHLTRGNTVKLSPRIREMPLDKAITTIPYQAVEAFLSRPRVLSKKDAEESPYVLSAKDGHLIAGAHNSVYVRGTDFSEGDLYNVISVGEPLVDPDDGHVVGFEGIFVGEGRIERDGDPATMLLTATEREVLVGNRLFPERHDVPLYFTPRSPQNQIDGRIISVVDATQLIGQYYIVVINRGARDGIETGHVLSVFREGEVVRDRFADGGKAFAEKVQLPEEYAGEMMVFSVEERISYALVVRAKDVIHVLDSVRTPQ